MGGLREQLGPQFDDVQLVISELVTNSVRHGPQGIVDVSVEASNETIRLEVSDGGQGFDPSAERDGLGLSIIEKIASNWGVVSGPGCTVWVELARPA
jgi:two-component sensor histidine kinase